MITLLRCEAEDALTLNSLGFLRNAEAHFVAATTGDGAWLTEAMMDAQLRQLRTRLQKSVGGADGSDRIVDATAALRHTGDSATFAQLEGLLRANQALQKSDPIVVADAWQALGAHLETEPDLDVKDVRGVLECYRRALGMVQGVAGPKPEWLGAVALKVVLAGPAVLA